MAIWALAQRARVRIGYLNIDVESLVALIPKGERRARVRWGL
jgi:hypothetical protein